MIAHLYLPLRGQAGLLLKCAVVCLQENLDQEANMLLDISILPTELQWDRIQAPKRRRRGNRHRCCSIKKETYINFTLLKQVLRISILKILYHNILHVHQMWIFKGSLTVGLWRKYLGASTLSKHSGMHWSPCHKY